jgi:hypothetical protein
MAEDFIDFTMLQKRGLLNNEEQSEQSEDVIDLTAPSGGTATSETSGASALSFFDNPSALSSGSSGSSTASPSSSMEVSDLKVRLENAEYKLERALERIAELERKSPAS